jgi:hypothetical protein
MRVKAKRNRERLSGKTGGFCALWQTEKVDAEKIET